MRHEDTSKDAGSGRTLLDEVHEAFAQRPANHKYQQQRHQEPLRMIIPYDPTTEGSTAGSRPDSDEDEPSVVLPHSAVKFVRRPLEINDGTDTSAKSPFGTEMASEIASVDIDGRAIKAYQVSALSCPRNSR